MMKLVGLRRLAAKGGANIDAAMLREFSGRQFTVSEVAYALDICTRTAQSRIENWGEKHGKRALMMTSGVRDEFDIWRFEEILPFDDGPENLEHDDPERCPTCGAKA